MRRSSSPSIQFPLNNLFTLPNHLPGISRVLRATASPIITKSVVIQKKVVVSGYIVLDLEYAAAVDSYPVCFASFTAPFAHFIEHRHAQPGLAARTAINLEYQNVDILDSRTITQLIILKISITKLETAEYYSHSYTTLPELPPEQPATPSNTPAPREPSVGPPFIKRSELSRRLWTGRMPTKWP